MNRLPIRQLAKVLASASLTIAVLGLLELGLRIADVPARGLYGGDPASLWFLRPDLDLEVPFPAGGAAFRVKTNSLGLRGQAPPEDEPWILALGCSTTFGWGVAEDEAWPARLEAALGVPVVNGGVPGWSTHQAVAGAARWLDLGPSRVVLAYIVRDAQLAPRPDVQARPTPWLLRTQLSRLVRGARGPAPTRAGPSPTGGVPRVSVADYEANLRTLVDRIGDAELTLLAFPQREPATAWVDAMGRVGPVLAPQLPEEAFFQEDPIHLTPEGHQRLADWVAARW